MNTNNATELLIEITRDIKSNVSDAKGFVLEQAPDVIQQLLVYNFWSAIACIAISIAILAAFYKIGAFGWSKFVNRDTGIWSNEELWIIVPAVCMMFSMLLLVGIFTNVDTCLKIKLSPKVYVIEYAAKLIK